jgi:hypothetical protein
MTQQGNGANNQDSGERQFVRGKFPRLPLRDAEELPKAVYEVGQGDEVRRLIVFNHLNRAPESGPSRALVTASSKAYGLTEGGTQSTHLKLTHRGRQLVESANETDRLLAAHESLFSPYSHVRVGPGLSLE